MLWNKQVAKVSLVPQLSPQSLWQQEIQGSIVESLETQPWLHTFTYISLLRQNLGKRQDYHRHYAANTTNIIWLQPTAEPVILLAMGKKKREALWELMFFQSIEKQMSFWCWTISTPVNYACGLEITPSIWDCFHFDCFLSALDNKNIFRQLNKSFITLMGLLVHSKQLCKLLIMRQR